MTCLRFRGQGLEQNLKHGENAVGEIYSILFFEAESNTTIHSNLHSVTIKSGEICQITTDIWRDSVDEARQVSLAELNRFRVDGTGSWFVGVFEAAEDGDDKELVWEKAA